MKKSFFQTCKSIIELLEGNATMVSAVKNDRNETQRHVLHKHQQEEERLRGGELREDVFKNILTTPFNIHKKS